MLDFIDFALKWAVAPLLAAIWHLDRKINGQYLKHMEHRAAIEVVKARLDAQTAASAASYASLAAAQDRILKKLDDIEEFLRSAH